MPNNFQGLLQNPAFMMGAGILGNNSGHYGAFGPAFGKGVYQAGVMSNRQQEMQMRMQEAKQREQLFKLQLEKAKRLAEKEKTARKVSKGLLARPPVDQSGTYSMGGYTQEGGDLFPGEQPIQGLLNQSPFEKDPTKATLEYYSEIGDFEGLMNAQLQLANREGKSYTSDYKNYLQTTPNPTPQGFADFMIRNKKAGASKVTTEVYTGVERKAAGRVNRLDQAEKEIADLEAQGMDVLSAYDKVITNLVPDTVQSLMRTDVGNRIAAAQNGWIQTHGRAESGAAINPSEWAMWRETYFPQPGEDPYTHDMKRRARQAVKDGLSMEAGRALIEKSKKGSKPPVVNSQADFNALPSGTVFIEDGKEYRKP